jgi:hypothetical protein
MPKAFCRGQSFCWPPLPLFFARLTAPKLPPPHATRAVFRNVVAAVGSGKASSPVLHREPVSAAAWPRRSTRNVKSAGRRPATLKRSGGKVYPNVRERLTGFPDP